MNQKNIVMDEEIKSEPFLTLFRKNNQLTYFFFFFQLSIAILLLTKPPLHFFLLTYSTFFYFIFFISFFSFFVYSKSGYTIESVSVSGRPSVRLHDNASKANPIVMKFCAQNRLIDISVEFEDENDWPTPSWFIAKNVIILVGLFHRVPPKKTQVSPNRPKGILSCRA